MPSSNMMPVEVMRESANRLFDMALIVANSIQNPNLHTHDLQDLTYDQYLEFREILDELIGSVFEDTEPSIQWLDDLDSLLLAHFGGYT